MSLKPLGRLKDLVESADMEISYAYDDLVFLDHNGFLLQFGDDGRTIFIHTNSGADEKEAAEGIDRLKMAAQSCDLDIAVGVFYTLTQGENETITIQFHE